MAQDIWYSDFECFAHDWLFVAKRQRDGETVAVWNDPEYVADFITGHRPILCGFNYRDYDSWLLKAVLLGWTPEQVNHVSQTIINFDDRSMTWALFQGHWVDLPPIIDLFHDVTPRKGLKEIEANIGMNVVESSVSFDIDRPLTEAEREEVTRYCLHDVEATAALYELRYDYLKAKADLCEMSGVDPLTMLKHTNARIVSEVLEAERLQSPHMDDDRYVVPDNVDRTAIPEAVLNFVESIDAHNCEGDHDAIEFMFHGCPTVVGLGGIHAAVPSYKETASDDRVILLQDIGSYYPSLILNNGYMSRAVADPSLYRRFYDMRMEAKAAGDKATAEAAKLVLNTTYGTMKDGFNKLYDPMQGTRVCLSGQLYILDLIEQMFRVYPEGLQLIQLNTDGWIISCPREFDIAGVVEEWQTRTGFTVDTAEVEVIVQANVNNYALRTTDGKVKTKGGVVAKYAGGDFKSNSMTIIDKAVTDYLLDGTPIEDTVNACDDIERFQIVAKAGRTFQKVVHVTGGIETDVQRTTRVYATTDETYGGIFKVKLEDGKETGRSKIPLTPEHCFIDNENTWKSRSIDLTTLDRAWYISLAKRKAHEFITRNKEEREQMAGTQEPNNELQAEDAPKPTARKKAAPKEQAQVPEPKLTFTEKLLALQIAMVEAASKVNFDKVVTNISHEYADTQQYKMWLSQTCSKLGLIFAVSIEKTEFLGVITPDSKTPSYGVLIEGVVQLTDVASGEDAVYGISGLGVNVNAGYCLGGAETNALRNFILNNYLLDNMGRDGDDVALAAGEATNKGYATADQKATIRQNIKDEKADEAQYATDIFARALYEKIIEAQKVKAGFAQKQLDAHFEADGTPKLREDGKSTLLKVDAVKGLTAAEEIIAKGGK